MQKIIPDQIDPSTTFTFEAIHAMYTPGTIVDDKESKLGDAACCETISYLRTVELGDVEIIRPIDDEERVIPLGAMEGHRIPAIHPDAKTVIKTSEGTIYVQNDLKALFADNQTIRGLEGDQLSGFEKLAFAASDRVCIISPVKPGLSSKPPIPRAPHF